VDAGHVACDAPLDWTTEGQSTVFLPGAVQHAASVSIGWDRPGYSNQSYGVAFLIDSCSWLPPADGCSSGAPYDLDPGPIPWDGTQGCMDVTLSGFVEADGYLLRAGGPTLVTAVTENEVSTHFCG
jgi:hypothetical protein